MTLTREMIANWVRNHSGVLTTTSAQVYRESYFGNDVIAPNSAPTPDKVDHRGYVPVELWIMSMIEADNLVRVSGEGMTKISIAGEKIPLVQLKEVAEDVLFGDHAHQWPLTKILDIGGAPVATSFGTTETPPIPVHVHGGDIRDGVVYKPGKSEAYFFPETNVAPYYKRIDAITRIGLKQGVTKEMIHEKLGEFAKSDGMYTLLNEFPVIPQTGWTVPEGVLHAPGPYITFEIQRPQDDYNLASWRLGERLHGEAHTEKYAETVLRGLSDEHKITDEVLDWEVTTDQALKEKYFHEPRILDQGAWGNRIQIFFDQFYGEGWQVLPGQTLFVEPKDEPQAGIVWSGQCRVNSNPIAQGGTNEFLCIPNTPLTVVNTGTETLFMYTVQPIRNVPTRGR